MNKQSLRGQRGTAAVEFAICVPSLLMLMVGTLYFGLALLARLQLTYLASETARTCVLEQFGQSGSQAYVSCALATFPSLQNIYAMHPCDNGGTPSLDVHASDTLDGSIPAQAASQINLLRITASCSKNINPIINGATGQGPIPASITVYGQAGMPFVLALAAR